MSVLACCCKKKVVFFLAEQVNGMNPTFEEKALSRIQKTGGGWAFSPRDFLDMGGRPTVDSGLHRLEKRGEIRRVIRGIYDYPKRADRIRELLRRPQRWIYSLAHRSAGISSRYGFGGRARAESIGVCARERAGRQNYLPICPRIHSAT
jgi:hypothetical protein